MLCSRPNEAKGQTLEKFVVYYVDHFVDELLMVIKLV